MAAKSSGRQPASADLEEPPRPSGRGTLNQQVVLDAAVGIVDEHDIHALTMRRLGAALNVEAMSIYSYFPSKAALVEAMVEREAQRLQDVTLPATTDPLEILVHVSHHFRRVLLEHPNLAATVAARPFLQDQWEQRITLAIALLRATGIPDEQVPIAGDALAGFALGFIVHEATELTRRAEMGEDAPALRRRLARRRSELEDGSPEALAFDRRIDHLDDPASMGATFEAGIRALLHGFGAR